MMTNNMMNNINKNKLGLNKLDEQYSTGKKIQRPSEDPVVAVRALKLRTNLSELNQYYEKNIPDAKSWMDVTESALTNINNILTQVNTYCVQGTTDTLTAADRTSITQNLEELKKQIYQEGNSNYAGRYVFTGYKTDTSLIFNEATTNLDYTITEKFAGSDIEALSKITDEQNVSDYNPATSVASDFNTAPNMLEFHRIRLSYDDLETMVDTDPLTPGDGTLSYTKAGVPGTIPITNVSVTSTTVDPYAPAAGTVNYIPETGELILANDVYDNLRLAENISVTYDKNKFKTGDLRPEHYFDCDVTNTVTSDTASYKKVDQQIQYEINFNQKLTINTQGSDAIKHGIGRDIDEIQNAVQDVTTTENKIAEVKKLLENQNLTANQKGALEKMSEQLNTELVLKNKIMHDAFEQGVSGSSQHQDTLNVAVADLGSRYVRLELTESRLSSQQTDFEELLSNNEDVDMVDTVIKYNSAQTIYNASLSAASKVVQNTLLNFL
jgi:flagellar hook-associated protein 3 FlgL